MKVIVIGGGIVGASAAYSLAVNKVEVIVVDKEYQGRATSAGAGIVCPWTSSIQNDDWYEIAKRGAQYYSTLISKLKEDGEEETGYKQVGALSVSTDSNKLDEIEKEILAKQLKAPEVGEVSRLNSEQARKLFPPLTNDLEAVFVSGAARVDGRLLRDAMIRAAKKHGAIMLQEEASLLYENQKVIGVIANGEAIYADQVLVTAGAWAPSLLRPLGIELEVEPQRGQIAHIKLPETDTSNWPVVLPQSSHYMLAFDDSRVVAGATRETGSGFDYRTTAGGIHEVLSEALEVAPDLSIGTVEEVRIGFRPIGPDVLPLIGRIDHIKGVVLATGLGASGLTIGPYVGTVAASLIKGDKVELDLAPYNPMRAITTLGDV
ncbi:FAD-binding oxidoreductase [Virgibacillus sp. C22-A2]|uniref:FAD-binding oxidoreductase n=1 Tax=Virgibacillus tibetensis TaxID=3042313 RepID=A0ABU6KKM6_9BACI|nr:FAD-binding oxidoreductase [Virgibacillus sp. C22-A2]